jgi:CubicO group peptidase (beta-lactamase class C family)
MRSIVVLATSIASFLSVTPRAVHAQAAGPAGSLDAAVVEVMTEWKLPGVVMVVVKDGTVLLNEGYGTRMVGQQLPVNGETLVQVASHTKAVTATALAMLVDAGDIEWDDPIRKHVPEFAVDDQYTTERVTVRDLMAHRGGLPAAALGGFQNADFGLDELLAALRTRQPQPLRARQVYSQPSIALAGEVVGRASGVSWEQFVRDRVFAPLGMTSSYTSTPDLIERVGVPSASSNIMIPARFRDGVVVSGTWSEIGTDRLYAPAGGITTNGADIAKWITALLQDGRYPGGVC